ncbi:hypothetical protein ASPZODRAFT_130514 [Penicilliopsis zonata CBS 506.65]|uniref:Uncharacterized protein n=1 Tax=Penicilliopsis zonata CBS 506.65 TaxID=1073090 RepID=A0A1L9SN47_9EURO|nr:hypothetical protein ASPZODRAFT_130514 [Penicilliopsis zonata CBS 506.65]OJJ48474.1 hypothetical protein ASPZODRAFT_130514 [Penicilliopsis zonata CBS 506.65]
MATGIIIVTSSGYRSGMLLHYFAGKMQFLRSIFSSTRGISTIVPTNHPNPGNFANRPKYEMREIARKGGQKGGKAKGVGGFHDMDPKKQVKFSRGYVYLDLIDADDLFIVESMRLRLWVVGRYTKQKNREVIIRGEGEGGIHHMQRRGLEVNKLHS